YQYQGEQLTFLTDAGVFSRQQIDFGTHVLLETIKERLDNQKNILDVGCGYGVIGLSIAKTHPDLVVTMVDVVTRAVELSQINAKQNGIVNVTIMESNLLANVLNSFDMIISNPPIRAGKKVVHAIVDQAYHKLHDGGKLLFVIQKKQGALSLKEKMETVFLNAEIINKKSGYLVLESEKMPKKTT
ncbi:MAG TPA: class I SAM-dependent methyltransferase, partial [Bacilli bacterium]|nr:class I SAM-dependent methyltransferase [Bacilli bacterium]